MGRKRPQLAIMAIAVASIFILPVSHVTAANSLRVFEQAKLVPNDAVGGIGIASAAAISGDTAVVTSLTGISQGIDDGAAYVFVRQGAEWTQQAKLTKPQGAPNDGFGHSVAISGDTVIVGAFEDNETFSGAAYIFKRTGTTWTQQARLTTPDPQDDFGAAVAVSGDTAVVGAVRDEINAGSVYVFVRNGETWIQQARLMAADRAVQDHLGYSVAIEGDTVVAGALLAGESGAAYVFTREGATWTETAKPVPSDPAPRAGFGRDIAISGDSVVVGTSGDNTEYGSAYVFRYDGESWQEETKLVALDLVARDRFGESVAISGNNVLIGASRHDGPGTPASGAAYLFTRSGQTWDRGIGFTPAETAAYDRFGLSVAIDGATAVIGSPGADTVVPDTGAAYVFLAESVCTIEGTSADDVLIGTAANDVICGHDGDDRLEGRGGNDILIGGRGNDLLAGNYGNDELWGQAGEDTLYGGPGDDLLDGGGDADLLRGGPGADELHGSAGADRLIGEDGDDVLWGGPGNDSMRGRAGHDLLRGGQGNDHMAGNQGDDRLRGEAGEDVLIGGPGSDLLEGGGDDDVLRGGDDNDSIHGDAGNDRAIGDAGNDQMWGDAGADLLEGREGDDTLRGGDGNDVLAGNEGGDLLIGGDGDDELYGGAGIDECQAGSGNNVVTTCDGTPWIQLGSDIDGLEAGEQSGRSVELNAAGNTVVIGAPHNSAAGVDAGQIRVFSFDSNGWSQVGAAINGGSGSQFGSAVAMSRDGHTIAGGAPWGGTGRARVLRLDGNGWEQVGNTVYGEASGDQFGSDVALNGDGSVMAVGARWNDGSGRSAGHVRIYRLIGSTWTQLGGDIDGQAENDGLGIEGSVALSEDGTTVAVGAGGNDGGGNSSGNVRILRHDGADWAQLGDDIVGRAGDSAGRVAISKDGTTVVVGATNDNSGPRAFAGAARVYRLTGNEWVQVGEDIRGEAAGDTFGASVAISAAGTTIAVGTHNNDANGTLAGHTRIFRLSGNRWVQVGGDLDGEAAGDWSGFSVSISDDGETVAIGAFHNDGGGPNAGHVRVYTLPGG